MTMPQQPALFFCNLFPRSCCRGALRRHFAAALALSLIAASVCAQNDLTSSKITLVKVYSGSATVERVARVAAGARSVTFACLPAALNVPSLQVSSNSAVRLGETSVLTEPRALSTRCQSSELDSRIRAVEDQKAALQAEGDALDMVTGYLKSLSGNPESAGSARPPVDVKSIASTADTLRRTAQETLQKKNVLARKQTDLDRQLAPLVAERNRTQGGGGNVVNVVNVTITLAAAADAEVKLSYRVNGPGWSPTYRALLDTTSRKVRIERQALVAQATGEDWSGVKLVLSTGQPQSPTSGRIPRSWRIGIEPPPRPQADAANLQQNFRSAPPAAAPAAFAPAMASGEDPGEPLFSVNVFNGSFATEFEVAQTIDVPSNGQRVAMALGQYEAPAKLVSRTSPSVEAAAYLVADLAQPEGVWPAGPLLLYRDGAFVGNSQWSPPSEERLSLSFGRDELLRVQVEPERDNQGSAGFAGSRAERRVQRAYVIENRHRTLMSVQVLEGAPVAVDDQVRVTSQFAPQPVELAWNKQPGLALWSVELEPGKTTRFTADHTISYPKDARLQQR